MDRRHDPDRSLLRCCRADLLAVGVGRIAPGLVAGDQLLAAALTVREPVTRFAVTRPTGAIDGAIGPQLVVSLPAVAEDEVVDVDLSATASLARTLHRALDPPVSSEPTGPATTHDGWEAAVESLAGDEVRQLLWSEDASVPTAAALVLALGPERLRRVRSSDGTFVVEDVSPAQVWTSCCVLAARATRRIAAASA